jgi:hypothetical protein
VTFEEIKEVVLMDEVGKRHKSVKIVTIEQENSGYVAHILVKSIVYKGSYAYRKVTYVWPMHYKRKYQIEKSREIQLPFILCLRVLF